MNRPWLKQPGECHDNRGVPIYPGDLLKTHHFIGARRKKYYLYHVVTLEEREGLRYLRMIPAAWADANHGHQGGDPLLTDGLAAACEVIAGYGPGDILDYDDRPKKRKDKS